MFYVIYYTNVMLTCLLCTKEANQQPFIHFEWHMGIWVTETWIGNYRLQKSVGVIYLCSPRLYTCFVVHALYTRFLGHAYLLCRACLIYLLCSPCPTCLLRVPKVLTFSIKIWRFVEFTPPTKVYYYRGCNTYSDNLKSVVVRKLFHIEKSGKFCFESQVLYCKCQNIKTLWVPGATIHPFACWHIKAETRWPPFRRRHFQIHFLSWKCMNYDFTDVCFKYQCFITFLRILS